jgi:dTDP-4-amino-4,6-dideoxygalactose transaminase
VPGVQVPRVRPGRTHAWFLYPIRVTGRDRVRARLAARGIETNVSWPRPLYDQPCFVKFRDVRCEVAEAACREVLCLPMYHELATAEQDQVVDALVAALKEA